jgi:hypothetical protein
VLGDEACCVADDFEAAYVIVDESEQSDYDQEAHIGDSICIDFGLLVATNE